MPWLWCFLSHDRPFDRVQIARLPCQVWGKDLPPASEPRLFTVSRDHLALEIHFSTLLDHLRLLENKDAGGYVCMLGVTVVLPLGVALDVPTEALGVCELVGCWQGRALLSLSPIKMPH